MIDGRKISKKILSDIKDEVTRLKKQPGLAIILVGNDSASELYVRIKEQACREVNIYFEKYSFAATTTEESVINKIKELNERKDIHGVVVQLPLPDPLNEDKIISAIDPAKDVDGFHPDNAQKLLIGEPDFIPALVQSVMSLLRATELTLSGKTALVVANSRVFYNFLAQLFQLEGIKSKFATPDKADQYSKEADILVVAVGRPGFITASKIKPGAVVIDIGINQTSDGVVGDVDQKSLEKIAGYLTPVPGGVGPVTVASLLMNTLKAVK